MIYDERFQLQASAEANYLAISLNGDAVYDEIALRMLTEDKPEFFLPISIKEINGRLTLRYKLINAVALKYSVDSAMTKKQYLRLASDLLTPFIKCKEWFFDYHHICIEPQYILRDRNTGKFLFAYMPERSLRNTDEEIIAFMESVLNYIDISDDKEFQIRMMHYFRSGAVSLSELYHMLSEERERILDGGSAPMTQTYQIPVQSEEVKPGFAATPEPPKETAAVQTPPAQNGAGSFIASLINAGNDNSAGKAQAESKEPEKKGFLDMLGISGAKNHKAEKSAANGDVLDNLLGSSAESNTGNASAQNANDNVMEGLFGSSAGKKSNTKQEKSSDGFGALFGGKKEPTEKPASGGLFGMRSGTSKQQEAKPAQTQQTAQTTPAQERAVGGYQPIGTPVSAGADAPTFIGGDQTMIDGLGGGTKYLELLDTQYTDCPAEISLAFDKPYIVIGRRSADAVLPDVAFPEQYRGVSRQHARITRNNDGTLSITDLGSAYGTSLNGQRLVPNALYTLTDGATLTFVESKPIRYRVHV